jgi:hypothetical protein
MPKPPDISEADMDAIDRYLAGALDASERAEFERRLVGDEALALELSRQRQVQHVLRHAVAGPRDGLAALHVAAALDSLKVGPIGQVGEALRQSAPHAWRPSPVSMSLIVGVVSLIVVAAGVSMWTWTGGGWGWGMGWGGGVSTTMPYPRLVASGFKATIEQADAAMIEAIIAEKLNASVTLPRSARVVYLGVRADVSASPIGVGVMARVDGRPVLLVLERVSADRAPGESGKTLTTEPSAGTFRHQRSFRTLRIVEWSDAPTPLLGEVRAK